MAAIRWTAEAEHWLQEIYSYIALDNPDAAGRVVKGIYEKAQMLRRHPLSGSKYRSEPEGDIRVVLFGHYRIAYLHNKDNTVDVLGVFHGALDIDKHLQQNRTDGI